MTTETLAHAAERSELDPRAVPIYPLVRMAAVRDGDAAPSWTVDNIQLGTLSGDPLAVLLDRARQRAAALSRVPPAVRARLIDGAIQRDFVVAADGSHWDITGPPPQGGEKRLGRQLPRWLFAGGVATLVVSGFAGSLVAVQSRRAEPAKPSASVAAPSAQRVQLPALAPQGYSPVALWASPPLATQGPSIGLARTADAVVVIGADRRLIALDRQTGAEKWSSPLAGGSLSVGPATSTIDGRPVIAAASSDTLQWWPLEGAREPSVLPLPSGATTTLTTGGPIVTFADRHQAQIVQSGRLVPRPLPAGAKPVGVDGPALLAADDTGQLWRITDERVAPAPTRLPAPPTVEPLSSLTVADGQLLTLWRELTTRMVVVTAFRATDGSPTWSARPAASPSSHANTAPPWAVAPDGSWLIVGTTAFNTATGAYVDLGRDWQLGSITNAAARSLTTLWSPRLKAPQLMPSASVAHRQEKFALPLESDGHRVFVAAADGRATRLYALTKEH